MAAADAAHATGCYVLFGWWNLFFERPWGLRGMENLLADYYDEPEQIKRLHAGLCDTYIRYIRAAARTLRPDGFWGSDDLGHQQGPMMGPATFRSLIYPYYERVGEALRESRMHFWLHSCGDNTLLLDQLAQAGVQVFHPVQKHTMDEPKVAQEFGQRMTFLAGIDVQHALQECDPQGVRAEVRFLIDTFDHDGGGMCLAAGNGIVAGTPFENIEAFLDEAVRYGTEHRGRLNAAAKQPA
jgi:uroporphyrinogen decarboxylase